MSTLSCKPIKLFNFKAKQEFQFDDELMLKLALHFAKKKAKASGWVVTSVELVEPPYISSNNFQCYHFVAYGCKSTEMPF